MKLIIIISEAVFGFRIHVSSFRTTHHYCVFILGWFINVQHVRRPRNQVSCCSCNEHNVDNIFPFPSCQRADPWCSLSCQITPFLTAALPPPPHRHRGFTSSSLEESSQFLMFQEKNSAVWNSLLEAHVEPPKIPTANVVFCSSTALWVRAPKRAAKNEDCPSFITALFYLLFFFFVVFFLHQTRSWTPPCFQLHTTPAVRSLTWPTSSSLLRSPPRWTLMTAWPSLPSAPLTAQAVWLPTSPTWASVWPVMVITDREISERDILF